MKTPTIGEMVNFALGPESNNPGAIRPAIVVQVWSEELVNLQVFVDGRNDYPSHLDEPTKNGNMRWETSVEYDLAASPFTWHRPGDGLADPDDGR